MRSAIKLARTLVPLFAASAISGCSEPATVTPTSSVMVMKPAHSREKTFDVVPPATAPRYEPIDIAFIFDGTQSMGGMIGAVQRSAGKILADVSSRSRNVRYAVAEFGDYHALEGGCNLGLPADLGRPVWRLLQDFSADPAVVQTAIGAVGVDWNGCDTNEAYLRALEETRQLGWRRGAARYVVLLGDAPARSPDPGRDELLGTDDDLVPATVASAYARDHITLIGIYAGHGGSVASDAVAASFSALASPTPHGLALPLKRDSDVRDLIRQALVEVPPPPPAMALVSPGYRAWVGTFRRTQAAGGEQAYKFRTMIMPPRGTAPGAYQLRFSAFAGPNGSGPAFGNALVTVRIGWEYYPLKPVVLLPMLLLAALILRALLSKAQNSPRWGLLFAGAATREFLRNLLVVLSIITLGSLAYAKMPADAHALRTSFLQAAARIGVGHPDRTHHWQ